MSEQDEFEKYLHKHYVRTDESISDYRKRKPRGYGQMLHSWQACVEQKDKVIEQQAAEIEALRRCIIELNNHNPEWLVYDLKAILYEHGLIDEKLKPTKLLTGE